MMKDIEAMTKEELVEYIKSLGEDVTGKYGLVWDKEKEPEKIVENCSKQIPVLKRYKKSEINNSNSMSDNLLIEGDNFHSLSILNYTHNESIDVIYIDPPYNTGNKDFVYNDKFIDKEEGYRHSKWLNFMDKRLKLSKKLLKENGIMFISIDDNEQAQLKLLCSSIFGENNIEEIIWQKQGNDNKSIFSGVNTIRNDHENIFIIYKNRSNAILNRPKVKTEFKNKYGNADKDPRGDWMSAELGKSDARSLKHGKNYFTIVSPSGVEWTIQWHFSEEKIQELDKDNLIYWGPDGKNVPRLKKFLDKAVKRIPSSLITDKGSTKTGKNDIKEIFGFEPFDYPKPVSLIKYLIDLNTNKNSLVLDFFAGSGTTGQAVLELNQEDAGNRQFILCTNNENKICEDVTYPRLKTVITGIRKDGSKYSDGIPSNLKYFKTDFVENSVTRDQLYYDLTEKCIPMLCVKENTFEEIETTKEYAIYSDKEKTKYTCVYFDIFGTEYDKFKDKIKAINEHKALYIFTLGDYINPDELKDVKNYSIEPIPYRILDLYKKVVKMCKED